MTLSARTSLALAVMTAIAHHATPEHPIGAASLVAHYQLSPRALEPVLQQLARLGLVHSVRGAKGGYYIPNPAAISAARIIEAVQPEMIAPQPLLAFMPVLQDGLADAQRAFLMRCETVTLADMSRLASEKGIVRALEETLDFAI